MRKRRARSIRAVPIQAMVLFTSVALIAGACGSGSGSDLAGARDAGTETDLDPEDQAIAESALLVLSDFPSGWEEQPGEDADDGAVGEIADCANVDYDEIRGGTGSAESGAFVSPSGDEVDSSVLVRATGEAAAQRFTLITSEEYVGCFAEAIDSLLRSDPDLPPGTSYETPIVNEVSFHSFGDESTAFRLTVGIEAEGFAFDLYVDIVLVRIGRGSVSVAATSSFSPFPADDLADYTQIAVDRLARALDDNSAAREAQPDEAESGDEPDGQEAEPQDTLASPFLQGTFDDDLPSGEPGEVSVVAVGPVEGSTGVVVRNNTAETVTVSLSGTARDTEGSLVASGQDHGVEPAHVEPGQIAIGYIYLGIDDPPPGSTIEVTAQGDRPDRQFGRAPVAIAEHNHTTGEFDSEQIVGLIRNDDDRTVSGISVLVACFDADGSLTSSHSGFTDGDDLEANNETSFSVLVYNETPCSGYLIGASGYTL